MLPERAHLSEAQLEDLLRLLGEFGLRGNELLDLARKHGGSVMFLAEVGLEVISRFVQAEPFDVEEAIQRALAAGRGGSNVRASVAAAARRIEVGPPAFSEDFRQRLERSACTRWATNVSDAQLRGLLYSVRLLSPRCSHLVRLLRELPEGELGSLVRARVALLELADFISFHDLPDSIKAAAGKAAPRAVWGSFRMVEGGYELWGEDAEGQHVFAGVTDQGAVSLGAWTGKREVLVTGPSPMLRWRGASVRVCGLPEYRAVVACQLRPTSRQVADYVDFVCGARSWSKYLPMLPPGEPFVFFLDPRAPESHSSQMAADEYRTRFGLLACQVVTQGEQPVFVSETGAHWVPAGITERGIVKLTGIIHQAAASFILSGGGLRRIDPEKAEAWPVETGGQATLQAIHSVIGRAQELRRGVREEYDELFEAELSKLKDDPTGVGAKDPELRTTARARAQLVARERWDAYLSQEKDLEAALDTILMPERLRLRRQMTQAIGRVLGLCYD